MGIKYFAIKNVLKKMQSCWGCFSAQIMAEGPSSLFLSSDILELPSVMS